MSSSSRPHALIVRMPNWLGDCIMALPVLRILRENFPEAHIAAQVRSPLAPLFCWTGDVDEVLAAPPGGGLQNLSAKWHHAHEVRQKGFDTGVLLPNSLGSALWMWQAGVMRRIGTGVNGRSLFLTDSVELTEKMRTGHQAQWYLDLLRPLGIERELDSPSRITQTRGFTEDLSAQENFIGESAGQDYAVLAPGSAYGPAKNWLEDNFISTARHLRDDLGLAVIITGSPADAEEAGRIADAAGEKVTSLAGKTTLGGFLALLSGASAFVGNDSGAAHCAAAFGLPTVVVFGSTRPGCTRPLGKYVAPVVGEASCAPCMGRECKLPDHPMTCMASVTVDKVMAAVKEKLADCKRGETE